MSFRIKFDPRAAKYTFLVEVVRNELVKAINEEMCARGLTKKELAAKINVNASVVSRRLGRQGNLTLRSIADFAWALDRDIIFHLVPPEDHHGCALLPSEHNQNTVFLDSKDNCMISHNREASLSSRSNYVEEECVSAGALGI